MFLCASGSVVPCCTYNLIRISNHLVSAMGDEEEGVTVPSRTLLLQVPQFWKIMLVNKTQTCEQWQVVEGVIAYSGR